MEKHRECAIIANKIETEMMGGITEISDGEVMKFKSFRKKKSKLRRRKSYKKRKAYKKKRVYKKMVYKKIKKAKRVK